MLCGEKLLSVSVIKKNLRPLVRCAARSSLLAAFPVSFPIISVGLEPDFSVTSLRTTMDSDRGKCPAMGKGSIFAGVDTALVLLVNG